MTTLQFDSDNSIYYEYTTPTGSDGKTFVFFNALTGDTGMWEAFIGPKLRKAGHGTLMFNFRGQADSTFSPGTRLNPELISNDAVSLLKETSPPRPVLVGLSIGGLFAAETFLKGGGASGLVLINTLRRNSARLKWINDAITRSTEVGGMDLLKDLFFPLLFNEAWLAANRDNFFTSTDYTPIDRNSGHYHLLDHSRDADWDIPFERLTLPTLVISGLQDHVFFEAGDMAVLYKRLPNAKRMDMPDAGHMIPVERPEAFTSTLLEFAGAIS